AGAWPRNGGTPKSCSCWPGWWQADVRQAGQACGWGTPKMNWMRALPEVAALPLDAGDLRRVGAHRDHWYPLAWSEDLRPGRVIGREFAGEPIALYRGASGQVFALEDRCAHRQVPLHLGKVEGESLKCGYHGWSYDCAGACID